MQNDNFISVEDRVKKIAVNSLGVNLESVKLESTLSELGADSLDEVELLMAVEEEFNIRIPEEDESKLKSVGGVVSYVEEALQKVAADV